MILDQKRKELVESANKKLKNQQVTCCICAMNVPAEKLADHSTNCRKRMELKKEISNLSTVIGNDIFTAVQNFREMNTKSLVIK